jgi:hypothetical protein
MRTGFSLLVLMVGAAACDGSAARRLLPTAPGQPELSGTFRATLVASESCASALPAAARVRTYAATLLPDGIIDWRAPTLQRPVHHRAVISSWTLSEQVFSISIDSNRDPQSDDFGGIIDGIGTGTAVTISGRGSGVAEGGNITGVLDGVFAVYDIPSQHWGGASCSAKDHGFVLTPSP